MLLELSMVICLGHGLADPLNDLRIFDFWDIFSNSVVRYIYRT